MSVTNLLISPLLSFLWPMSSPWESWRHRYTIVPKVTSDFPLTQFNRIPLKNCIDGSYIMLKILDLVALEKLVCSLALMFCGCVHWPVEWSTGPAGTRTHLNLKHVCRCLLARSTEYFCLKLPLTTSHVQLMMKSSESFGRYNSI